MGSDGRKVSVSTDRLRNAAKALGAAADVFERARNNFDSRVAAAHPPPWTSDGIGAQWDQQYNDSERTVKETLDKVTKGLRDLSDRFNQMSMEYEKTESENSA